MIRLEKTEVYGWEASVRGMRNPLNSWDKSDSIFGNDSVFVIGDCDLDLMQKLAKAGSDHRKFLRQIMVSVDITSPFYWWKEFDTYKVGTTANSCSTMHTIHKKPFELDDFSHEHLFDGYYLRDDTNNDLEYYENPTTALEYLIAVLNHYRLKYLETKDKRYWWQMIQLLPASFNQKRTITLNYEVLLNMYHARKNHKLDEWHTLCDWIESLPYFKEICLDN